MATQHTATAREGTPRAEEWLTIFGSRTVYLVMAEPVPVQLGDTSDRFAYLLDVPSLTDEQRERIGMHLCETFHLSVNEVKGYLDKNICPISLGDDLVIATQPSLVDGWF